MRTAGGSSGSPECRCHGGMVRAGRVKEFQTGKLLLKGFQPSLAGPVYRDCCCLLERRQQRAVRLFDGGFQILADAFCLADQLQMKESDSNSQYWHKLADNARICHNIQ